MVIAERGTAPRRAQRANESVNRRANARPRFDTPGTPAAVWQADPRWAGTPALDLTAISSLVVIAAHPDDETLGVGGIIHACAARAIDVHVIIVTDGAASHPDDVTMPSRRADEARAALAELAPSARLTLLGFADGETREHRTAIRAALAEVLAAAPDTATVLAPWRGDGHRDHRVVGELAAELVDPARFGEYPVWMWHWGHPDHPDVDWARMRSATIDSAVKQRAIAAYTSQTDGASPVVTGAVLTAAAANREFVITAGDAIVAFLDSAYARRDDPWSVETRWYEQRKREMTLASLPKPRYGRTLEVGCSIGVLTTQLADRCSTLLAVDLSSTAVERARVRLAGRRGVEVRQLDVRAKVPTGPFDLVVLSEVGYYLTPSQLDRALTAIETAMGDTGTLVACHWRHPVAAHTLTGDEVHAIIAARGLPRLAHHVEADFVLDVYSRDACSVAQHEGIV